MKLRRALNRSIYEASVQHFRSSFIDTSLVREDDNNNVLCATTFAAWPFDSVNQWPCAITNIVEIIKQCRSNDKHCNLNARPSNELRFANTRV